MSIPCGAQEALSWSPSDQTRVAWTPGPADASLGALANIKISKGYRFTGAAGARDLLRRLNNPIPAGLVGILAPESGQWWAVLTYKDLGYVKNAGKSQIDTAKILKAISDRTQRQNEDRMIHGVPLITSVEWQLPPVFDAKTHTLEWAVRVKTQSAEIVNHTMRLLGRRGVLDATVVEPYQVGAALAPLKQIMKDITFKPGQRYTDFQKGDTVADIGLAELVAGTDDSAVAKNDVVATATKSAGVWNWYAYVGLGVLAGGTILLLRRMMVRRRRKAHRTPSASRASYAIGNGNGIADEKLAPERAKVTLPISAAPGNGDPAGEAEKPGRVPVPDINSKEEVEKREAEVREGSSRRHARRKKMFDYHRFYTDAVMKLSSGGYTEFSATNSRVNGNGVNGHSVDHPVESQPLTNRDANQAFVQAHLDLIANQKDLIEEQKRLMIQQARLIEEKSKLIVEKSQLLDRQAELFERDVL